MSHGYAFIASPYSAPTYGEMYNRFREVLGFTAWCFKQRQPCYSPIAHWHEVATTYSLPTDAAAWLAQNEAMLLRASILMVLMLPGWDVSYGVLGEIKKANEIGLPVLYYEPFDGGYRMVERRS